MNIGMTLCPEFEELYKSFAEDPTKVKYLDIEGISPQRLDVGVLSHEFFEKKLSDTATDSNSNANKVMSPSSYRMVIANNQMKLLGYHTLWYYSKKRYGLEWANKAISEIWKGSLYFHDAHGVKIQEPYCYAFSLASLVLEGRPYGPSPNTPPKHRKSFLSQVDKLIGDLSRQFAGATAPSDFFLWYAYFCKKEHINPWHYEDKQKVIQDMQGLVCLFNDGSRVEGDPPFTNLAIYDKVGLQNLFGKIIYPDGSKPNMAYIDCLQRIFVEWFSHGNQDTHLPFAFPVVTFNLTTDEHNDFVDEESARSAAHYNRKLGNFNLHYGSKAKVAMCCRYENDLSDMNLTPDSFGNGGVNIGSHRVVTLNLPKISILANYSHDRFEDLLDEYMDMASKLLIVHRYDILQRRIEKNPDFLPFFGRLGWFKLDGMFSTFGITGIHEMAEFMGYDILDDDGTDFVLDTLQHIKTNVKHYRSKYNVVFNVEEIPGEQACPVLAQKDDITFDGKYHKDLYSNQYIPLTSKADIISRVELSGRFMEMVSGGGIVHLNIQHEIDTDEKMYELMRFSAKSGVSHEAICYRYGVCENGHAHNIGQTDKCPECGAKFKATINRVIGYFSVEGDWHPVRQQHDAKERYFTDM